MTYANQKIIRIKKEKYQSNFLQIGIDEWQKACKEMKPSTFKLYLYLAGNANGFDLALSQVAVENAIGIKKSAYSDAIKELEKLGYLTFLQGNVFIFTTTSANAENLENWENHSSANAENCSAKTEMSSANAERTSAKTVQKQIIDNTKEKDNSKEFGWEVESKKSLEEWDKENKQIIRNIYNNLGELPAIRFKNELFEIRKEFTDYEWNYECAEEIYFILMELKEKYCA